MKALFKALMLAGFGLVMMAPPALAEVRIGKNVRVGGHILKPQTFNAQRRGEYHIYNRTPPHQGCHWRSNADGSRTRVCHLKRRK